MIVHRRAFLSGLFAAPAIVSMVHIMPVRLWKPWYSWRQAIASDLIGPAYDLMRDGEITGIRAINAGSYPLSDANILGPELITKYGDIVQLVDFRPISPLHTKIITKNGEPYIEPDNLELFWPVRLAPVV